MHKLVAFLIWGLSIYTFVFRAQEIADVGGWSLLKTNAVLSILLAVFGLVVGYAVMTLHSNSRVLLTLWALPQLFIIYNLPEWLWSMSPLDSLSIGGYSQRLENGDITFYKGFYINLIAIGFLLYNAYLLKDMVELKEQDLL